MSQSAGWNADVVVRAGDVCPSLFRRVAEIQNVEITLPRSWRQRLTERPWRPTHNVSIYSGDALLSSATVLGPGGDVELCFQFPSRPTRRTATRLGISRVRFTTTGESDA